MTFCARFQKRLASVPTLLLLSCIVPLAVPQAVFAAEKIVMKYGPARRSLPVEDLRQLVDTGKTSSQLRSYLRVANQPASALRQKLTQPLKVDVVTLDSRLNSIPGNLLLDEAGRYIHPPGKQGRRQALRSALILSASSDSQITMIEALEYYPTQVVEVEVDKTLALYKRIDGVLNQTQQASPAIQQAAPVIDLIRKQIQRFF